jgi:hypothetical protein
MLLDGINLRVEGLHLSEAFVLVYATGLDPLSDEYALLLTPAPKIASQARK